MIKFKTVRFKNFLSYGNQFSEITLDKHRSTLILGPNGNGKSTILDAISYGLYNKAFRNINKPQLINSINQKSLVVEVEFSIANKDYLIRRGQKPTIFEIFQNGVLLNQVSDTRDYQNILEQNILKMNYRSFRQIVVLGSADFIPFMQLPAQARREVIEDLLDMQAFSLMNTLLKNKIGENKDSLSSIQHKIDIQENIISLQTKHYQEIMQSTDTLISNNESKITDLVRENASIKKEIEVLSIKKDELQSKLNEKITSTLDNAVSIRKKLDIKLKKYENQEKFYIDNTNCPTCEQSIDDEFRHVILTDIRTKKTNDQNSYNELLTKISKIEKKLSIQSKIVNEIEDLEKKNNELVVSLNMNNRMISSIETEIEEIKSRNAIRLESMNDDSEDKLIQLKVERETIVSERETLGIAATLLKDGGIKSRIIKQYVPVINKIINKYLQAMEFNVDFQLDETFKETLYSRGRDDFSYASFSQGEKMRIDLSILFAWREISKLRNSASTNLLIFDEIFDSSLDIDGTDDFIKILNTLSIDTNTFIISHKVDALADKFDNTITIKKVKNFSRIIK